MTKRTNYWNQNKVKGGIKLIAQSYMKDNTETTVVLLSSCSNVGCCSNINTSCSNVGCCSNINTSCSNVGCCSNV